jgi:hypothetical protein
MHRASYLGFISLHPISHFALTYQPKLVDRSVRHTSAVFSVTAVRIFETKVGPEYVHIFINFLLHACGFSDFPDCWRHIHLEHYTAQLHKRVSSFGEMYCLHLQCEYIKFRLIHRNTFKSSEDGSSVYFRNVGGLHDFKKVVENVFI